MTFRDTLGLALRNLGQAKLRTSLTTLGVSIGIASLAGMVSLGVGLQDQLVGRFTKSGMFDADQRHARFGRARSRSARGGRGRGGGRGFGRRSAAAARSPENAPARTHRRDAEGARRPAQRQGRLSEPARAGRSEVRQRRRSSSLAAGVPMAVQGAKARSSRSRTAASSTATPRARACSVSTSRSA